VHSLQINHFLDLPFFKGTIGVQAKNSPLQFYFIRKNDVRFLEEPNQPNSFEDIETCSR
jgi:hypothetical protein